MCLPGYGVMVKKSSDMTAQTEKGRSTKDCSNESPGPSIYHVYFRTSLSLTPDHRPTLPFKYPTLRCNAPVVGTMNVIPVMKRSAMTHAYVKILERQTSAIKMHRSNFINSRRKSAAQSSSPSAVPTLRPLRKDIS